MTDSRHAKRYVVWDILPACVVAFILAAIVAVPAAAHPTGVVYSDQTFEDGSAVKRYAIDVQPNTSRAFSCPRGYTFTSVHVVSGYDGRRVQRAQWGDGVIFRAHATRPGTRYPSYRVAVAVERARAVGHYAIGAEGTHAATVRVRCSASVPW